MAEFALGLTKTAVEGTVSRIKSAIDDEAKLKVRVQNDLVFITGEFEMMQSFLNVAKKERTNNEVVRTWVRQIRELAFDVEDCVELVISLDIKSGWSWLWRVLPSCMAPQRPLDQAVTEIQRLKARVEDVSHRNTRYNLICDSGSHTNSKPAVLTSGSSLASEPMPDACAAVAFDMLRGVWESTDKMHRDMGDLRKLITNEGVDLEVISLWGSPGSASDLGVTHVIREAYNDPEICQKFKSRAWIKLMHPFNPNEFLNNLLAQFYPIPSHHQENALGAKFRKEMREAVNKEDDLMKAWLMQQVSDEQKYLVIVEQLSTMVEWETIRMYLPGSKHGSRIVLTTQQLGLALTCTGKPYQVSELRRSSDGQSLCAFFNKVSQRRSDMCELIWQLRGDVPVISVYKHADIRSSTLIDKVYTGITNKSKEFDGVKFQRHCWVDVPYPFNLDVFSRHLFLNFHSNDLRTNEIVSAGTMGNTGVVQGCCKFLRQERCLVIIDGLDSTDDWDLIKATFLSEPNRSCILVITEKVSVAGYCLDKADQAFNIKKLDADVLLRHSMKGCEFYGVGGKEASSRGHFFSHRREKAHNWSNKFKFTVDPYDLYYKHLRKCLNDAAVISLCGTDACWRTALARKIYYYQMLITREEAMPPMHGEDGEILDFEFTKFSWVDVPHPFDLMDFFWRLFLDFHSDDLKAKQIVAFGMMEGCHDPIHGCLDPIQGCLQFLRQDKCLIVINGLRSTYDWNIIKDTLLCDPTKGCIIVTTDVERVAKHCAHHKNRVFMENCQSTDVPAHVQSTKKKWYSDKDGSGTFSSRMLDACDCINKFELIEGYSGWDRTYKVALDGSPPHGVTSVWGIAGVGKSAPVKSFYYKTMIGDLEQVRKYSWVDVPQPFNLTDFSRKLIMDFNSDDLDAKQAIAVGMIEGQDPIQGCRRFLQEENYFVVFDGLCSIHDWDLIKDVFLSEPIKGTIFVITNEKVVARHCVDEEDRVFNVKGLDFEAGLRLFKKIAWNGKQLSTNEVHRSDRIVRKCGGLPKVINVVGESLGASYTWDEQLVEGINTNFMGLLETDPRFHRLRGLFSWMQSYFDACPDYLKPCIFYLSVFPFGDVIRRRRLLRRWIAEGYSRGTHGNTAEENAEEYFCKLVELSIIIQQKQQQEPPSRTDVWKVNGFLRGYIISRPMQDNLTFALEARGSHNWQGAGTGQHLTVSKDWVREKTVFESMELSRLRSLTIFGDWRSFFISTNVNMGLLRVLDLEDTSGVGDDDIEQIGKLLLRLKFLSLRGCKEIIRLPRSLGGLRQLQTLDVKGTSIIMLPSHIVKLQKLQYIRAGEAVAAIKDRWTARSTGEDGTDATDTSLPAQEEEVHTTIPWSSRARDLFVSCSWLSNKLRCRRPRHSGVKVPVTTGIGKLTALHTFGILDITISGKAILKELKKLSQLRKLAVSGINRENWSELCSVISGSLHLQILSVQLDNNEEKQQQEEDMCCLGDISEPPNTLKSVKFYGGNVHVSAGWMKQVGDNLIKTHFMELQLLISTQEDIDSLVALPCKDKFRHICLKPTQDGELHYERLEAPSDNKVLKAPFLKIDCSSYKLTIDFGGWIPTYVEVLVVHCSTNEASLDVSGLEKLCRLKEVWLKGSYSDTIKQHLQQKVDEHEKKPVLNLDPRQPAPPTPCACQKRFIR